MTNRSVRAAVVCAFLAVGCSGGGGSANTDAAPASGSGGGRGIGTIPGPASGGAGGAGGAAPVDAGRDTRRGGRVDAAGRNPTPDAAPVTPRPPVEVTNVPPLPPRRAGYSIFHSTNVSMWEIHDPAVYNQFKGNFDEIIGILEAGYFAIADRLGTGLELPVRVIIPPGGCCGGFAGGGDVGYNDGDFKSAGGMNWVRGVVLGEVVNNVTGQVSSDWPRDWWADTAWYFPGFVAVDVMREVVPAYADKWEVEEKYPTYPTYVLFRALLGEQGWPVYQRLFALVKTDKMAWNRVGANPSALKTNYVIAYLSVAAGANLGERFKTAAQVTEADPAVVQAIMDARKRLVDAAAAGRSTTAGWARFLMGDYQGATTGL